MRKKTVKENELDTSHGDVKTGPKLQELFWGQAVVNKQPEYLKNYNSKRARFYQDLCLLLSSCDSLFLSM